MANGVTFTSSIFVLAAVGTLIPPHPPSIDTPLKAPIASADSKGQKVKANDFASSKGTSKPTKKMCPSATRNGCNLYALHWLKQLKTNGVTDKFCLYYRNLTAEQCKDYDNEASVLVTGNIWEKNICDGAIY
ncbi:hypothetical protein P692DRAFT_20736226 [Suillus brevipes Sb2]|nr:hypothetical protein P692DRAFT_20736226 [Suillus brevipes Sb2]